MIHYNISSGREYNNRTLTSSTKSQDTRPKYPYKQLKQVFTTDMRCGYNKHMICPNDKIEMKQVKIISHYGQPIDLEQCEKCGGIWFDEAELYRAKQGEAKKIEILNTDILRNPSVIENSTLICPRDHTILQRFTDRYFPQDIILERCQLCNGIWLNRGIFTKYQNFRQELKHNKENSLADKKLEENIRQLIESHRSGRSTDTLERLGKFLSTPVDGDTLTSADTTQRSALTENAVSVALNIIMTILRVFIFKF